MRVCAIVESRWSGPISANLIRKRLSFALKQPDATLNESRSRREPKPLRGIRQSRSMDRTTTWERRYPTNISPVLVQHLLRGRTSAAEHFWSTLQGLDHSKFNANERGL